MANKLKRAVEQAEPPKTKKTTIPKSKQSTLTFKTVKPKRNEVAKPSIKESIKEEVVKPTTKRKTRDEIPSETETETIEPPKKKRTRRGLTQSIDAADAPKQSALELQRCRLLQVIENIFFVHPTQTNNATDTTSDQSDQSQFFLSIVKCKDLSSVRQQCVDRFGDSKIERIETQLACCETIMELSDCNACSLVSPFTTCCNKCFSADVQLKSRTIDWRLVRMNQAKLVQAAAKKLEKTKSKGQVDSADEDAEISSSPESSPEPSPSPESSPALKAMRITSFASEPMSESELYQLRIECVLRSLDWSGRFAKRAKITNIDAHGGDMAFLYRFVIDMSEDVIKEAAVKTVQTMIDKWEKSDLSIIDSHAEAEQVLEFTEALHAKIGMQLIKGGDSNSRDLTRQRQNLSKAVSHHSISDLCRFNASLCGKLPRTQSGYCTSCGQFQRVGLMQCPLDDTELIHPKDLEALCESVVWLGVFRDCDLTPLRTSDGDTTFDHALHFIRECRPYQPRSELGHDQFRFQCYLLTHLCFILSTGTSSKSWYENQLDRTLMIEEFMYLYHTLDECIKLKDPELVGEIVCCLRLFGVQDSDPAMIAGYAFLLSSELTGSKCGSWLSSPKHSFYQQYHAAYCGIIGLAPFACKGKADLESVKHLLQ